MVFEEGHIFTIAAAGEKFPVSIRLVFWKGLSQRHTSLKPQAPPLLSLAVLRLLPLSHSTVLRLFPLLTPAGLRLLPLLDSRLLPLLTPAGLEECVYLFLLEV